MGTIIQFPKSYHEERSESFWTNKLPQDGWVVLEVKQAAVMYAVTEVVDCSNKAFIGHSMTIDMGTGFIRRARLRFRVPKLEVGSKLHIRMETLKHRGFEAKHAVLDKVT